MMMLRTSIFATILFFALSSDVIILTNENFEHDTQASTGATTGDWLVEFYAPWCGHCKSLAPIWEELATQLKGEVNVAKVDVTANGRLGKRFGIQGFPTILLFHKGKQYKYKGRRTGELITNFARGGYKDLEGEDVKPLPGMIDEIKSLFTSTFQRAIHDIESKNYFSPNIIVLILPLVFLVFIALLCLFIPSEEDSIKIPTKLMNSNDDTQNKKDK